MVQYRKSLSITANPEDYWKLHPLSEMTKAALLRTLRRYGYLAGQKTPKARLEYLVSRIRDRKLVVYETCDAEELRAFCRRRGIHIPKSANRKQRRLISLLEGADEDIAFNGFFEQLPAEIRARVYKEHFDWLHVGFQCAFTTKKGVPGPPPLITASRQLYEETYGNFYATMKIPVEIYGRIVPPDHSSPVTGYRLFHESRGVFSATPLKILASLRHIEICVILNVNNLQTFLDDIKVTACLKEDGWTITLQTSESSDSKAKHKDAFLEVARLEEIVRTFFVDKNRAVLRREDGEVLCKRLSQRYTSD